MLIVSKFHDYYDTAMGMGIDKTCVYNRTTIETLSHSKRYVFEEYRQGHYMFQLTRYKIGFCGVIYLSNG